MFHLKPEDVAFEQINDFYVFFMLQPNDGILQHS